MSRFIIKKNTLPYIHQWAVIETNTNKKIGEYKTEELARQAIQYFEQHGVPENDTHSPQNALDAAKIRMQQLNGDPPLSFKKGRYSNERPVELD